MHKKFFPDENKENYKLLYNIIRDYKFHHLIAGIFMILNTAISIILPLLFMEIIDSAISKKNTPLFIKLVIVYFIAMMLQTILGIVASYIYSLIGNKIILDLRKKILKKMFSFGGEFYNKKKTGELMQIVNGDTSAIQQLTTDVVYNTLSDIVIAFGMNVFLAYLNFDLFLVVIFIQPFIIPLQKYFNNRIKSTVEDIRESTGEMTSLSQEMISSANQFIIYGVKKYFVEKYTNVSEKYYCNSLEISTTYLISSGSISLVGAISFILALGFGGNKVLEGQITLGCLITFIQYSQRTMGPLIRVAQLTMKINQSTASLERICKILFEKQHVIKDGLVDKTIRGEINFTNVCFGYENNRRVLENIDLKFEPGKKYAIVGTSGAGKTTIVNLILRLWDVTTGRITLDEKNIEDYNLEYLRSNISIVSQDPFLINDSIINNLYFDKQNKDENRIIDILKKVSIYDDILHMEQSINSNVGERGAKLSGGQKQRLEIARALLRDTPVVILDEPTSALDIATETIIKKSITEFFKNKTVIIISHKLSFIDDVDEIILLKDGKASEVGTHLQLYNLKGGYFKLFNYHHDIKGGEIA